MKIYHKCEATDGLSTNDRTFKGTRRKIGRFFSSPLRRLSLSVRSVTVLCSSISVLRINSHARISAITGCEPSGGLYENRGRGFNHSFTLIRPGQWPRPPVLFAEWVWRGNRLHGSTPAGRSDSTSALARSLFPAGQRSRVLFASPPSAGHWRRNHFFHQWFLPPTYHPPQAA